MWRRCWRPSRCCRATGRRLQSGLGCTVAAMAARRSASTLPRSVIRRSPSRNWTIDTLGSTAEWPTSADRPSTVNDVASRNANLVATSRKSGRIAGHGDGEALGQTRRDSRGVADPGDGQTVEGCHRVGAEQQRVIGREEGVVIPDHRVGDVDRVDQAEQLPIGPTERRHLHVVAVLGERQARLTRRRVVLDDDLGVADDRAVCVAARGVMGAT